MRVAPKFRKESLTHTQSEPMADELCQGITERSHLYQKDHLICISRSVMADDFISCNPLEMLLRSK